MNISTILDMHISDITSKDSTVGIATGYGLDEGGRSSSPDRVKNFLLSMSSRPALGFTQSPIQWIPGGFSPGDKAAGT
jgi:hypothetical protein